MFAYFPDGELFTAVLRVFFEDDWVCALEQRERTCLSVVEVVCVRDVILVLFMLAASCSDENFVVL